MSKLVIEDINQNDLNENPQKVYMLFAILKKRLTGEYCNVTPLMLCRDYFSDVVYIQKLKLNNFPEVYGFYWSYNKWFDTQVTKNKYTDMLIVVNNEVYENIKRNFLLIHRFETMLGFPLTKFTVKKQVTWELIWGTSNICLHVKVPSKWWSNSLLISLYTLLWRLCGYDVSPHHDMSFKEVFNTYMEEAAGSTTGILKNIRDGFEYFEYFLTNWESLIGTSPQPFSIEDWKENHYDPDDDNETDYKYRVHNGSGIQSFMQGISSPHNSELAIRDWCIKITEEYTSNV